MEKSASKVFIGTSGWHYDSWRGPFFPQHVPKWDWLEYYADNFCTTELNGVFYRTPSKETVKAWCDATPDNFVFSWKASKFITHWKRLGQSSRSSLQLMETRLKFLRRKLGPILFQLPPKFESDRRKLSDFLQLLPKKHRYAFEFRDASWYDEDVFKILQNSNVALCISDHRHAPSPWIATAEHVYIRGHGPFGDYKGNYKAATLRKWSLKVEEWRNQGRDVFVYFDNDQKSAAPADAFRLVNRVQHMLR
jgi:uncharacterized protein YecE (DUF72 family)